MTWELVRDGNVKTKKDHKCHGCLSVIYKNTEVYRQVVAGEGTVETLYMCDDCKDYCKNKNCNDCYMSEGAHEGYIKECMKENGEWKGE